MSTIQQRYEAQKRLSENSRSSKRRSCWVVWDNLDGEVYEPFCLPDRNYGGEGAEGSARSLAAELNQKEGFQELTRENISRVVSWILKVFTQPFTLTVTEEKTGKELVYERGRCLDSKVEPAPAQALENSSFARVEIQELGGTSNFLTDQTPPTRC